MSHIDAQESRPQAGRRTVTPIWRAAYWISTSMTALAFAGIGAANLAHAHPIMQGLEHLGYPPYIATILGAWKVLAAVALVSPGLRGAREWAYAGMAFTLTGAALSHAFKHDAPVTIVAPLVLLIVAMVSWSLGRLDGVRVKVLPDELTGADQHVER